MRNRKRAFGAWYACMVAWQLRGMVEEGRQAWPAAVGRGNLSLSLSPLMHMCPLLCYFSLPPTHQHQLPSPCLLLHYREQKTLCCSMQPFSAIYLYTTTKAGRLPVPALPLEGLSNMAALCGLAFIARAGQIWEAGNSSLKGGGLFSDTQPAHTIYYYISIGKERTCGYCICVQVLKPIGRKDI